MTLHDDMDNRLGFHPGTPETAPRYELNRSAARRFAHTLIDTCPPSRELSLALTAVEDALMRANQAVAIHLSPLGGERTDPNRTPYL